MADHKPKVQMLTGAASAMLAQTVRATKALGVRANAASPEAKSATVGGAALGGVGLLTGSHVGIAALGTAVSGALLLPAAGVAVGALAGYSAFKFVKDRKAARIDPPVTASPADEN